MRKAAPARRGETPASEVPECPVQSLGHRAGTYFFISPSGEVRSLSAGEMNDLRLGGLFDGPTAWLAAAAPDLLSQPESEWLIDGIIQRGTLAMIYGPSGCGKSFSAAPASITFRRSENT